VTSPSPGEFADVSKGYVSCLHNAVRQVDLYMLYQKCAEFLQNEAAIAGDLVWMNDINKEESTDSISGNDDEVIVSYSIISTISFLLEVSELLYSLKRMFFFRKIYSETCLIIRWITNIFYIRIK